MAKKNPSFYIEQETLIAMVESLQREDPDAKTVIFNTFHDKIYGHIMRLTNDKEITDLLLSAVFSEIFSTVHKLKNPAAFVTWCNRIVMHQVAAHYRKLRREIAKEEKYTRERPQEEVTAYDNIYVEELLNKLPPKKARVLKLHLVDRIPVSEIAAQEGIPEGTVKSRLFYGRKALKEILVQNTK